VREYGFELRLCARLERRYEGVVARQVGAAVGGERVMDSVVVTPGPEFEKRARITDGTVPPAVLEADVGVRWTPVTRAFGGPAERADALAERGVEAGFLEREFREGTDCVRAACRYPDWFDELLGFEHKPDLSRPGDLYTQLRKDTSLGLLDSVVLTTASHVTGAHLNRIPPEIGVWRVDFEAEEPIEVVREAESLPEGAGLQIEARRAGKAEVRAVSAAEKARQRRRVAERAYGKGWRPGFPACARVERFEEAGAALPFCPWKGEFVNPNADCGVECAGHEPAAPPETDPDAERAARTAWVADPEGARTEQARLGGWRSDK
jgi:hypothetical protein